MEQLNLEMKEFKGKPKKARINMYKIIAIVGKSGSGKSRLLEWLTCFFTLQSQNKDKYNIIIPTTTRPQRPNEINGVDYNFITEDMLTTLAADGQIAEISQFRDWYYATLWKNLDNTKFNIGILTPHAIEILEENPNVIIQKIYISCPDDQRLIRQLQRIPPDADEVVRRYSTDKKDFSGFNYDYIINNENGNFMAATERLYEILQILSEPQNVDVIWAKSIK